MKCPQCGLSNAEEAWNCSGCGLNLYWGSVHYPELAGIRRGHGLAAGPQTPAFLLLATQRVRGHGQGAGESKVRALARRQIAAQR